MIGSGNIDNALDALNAAIAELDTRMASGEHLSAEDVEYLAELTTTNTILRNKSIVHFSASNSDSAVAAAFNITIEELREIKEQSLSNERDYTMTLS